MARPTKEEVTVRRGRAAAAEEVAEVARPVARPTVRRIAALTAEELGTELFGNYETPPNDLQELGQNMLDDLKASLVDRVEANIQRALAGRERGASPEIGEPIVGSAYEFWDIRANNPQQFLNPPFTFRPHKIVAGDEWVLLSAVLFVNPLPFYGGPSATQFLGGRPFRVRFEQIDLTNVTNFTDITFIGSFPANVPVITIFSRWIRPTIPDRNPRLVEFNVTADIRDPLQPFAALATQWLDVEGDLDWPIPGQGGMRTQAPLRYLIYPE